MQQLTITIRGCRQMFYINKDTILDEALLQKMISSFVLNVQPKMQKWKNYYEGKHVILDKS